MKDETSLVLKANKELSLQLANDPSVMRALTQTIFKGFKDERLVRQACLEAMIRGYSFQDILKKKIYAIPYAQGYSLVQSIGDARAIAMKGGQAGKSAPEYTEKNGKIETCTIMVKRNNAGIVGEYTATVYFDEYYKEGKTYNGVYTKSQWDIRPRTMIAKVAEMHALRMAFPEELDQAYVEEEFDKDNVVPNVTPDRLKLAKEASEGLKMSNHAKKEEKPTDDASDAEIATHEDDCGFLVGKACTCIPTINQ